MKKILIAVFVFAAVALFAQEKVYTPALNSPDNEAVDQMPDVILSWDAVQGSSELVYRIQLDTNNLFENPVNHTVSLISGWAPMELDFFQEYFWRVRAVDLALNDSSDWSEVRSFTTFEKILLSMPLDDITQSKPKNVVVDLKWKPKIGQIAISGFDFVEIEYDTSMLFNSPWFHLASSEPDNASGIETAALLYGKDFRWRARAIHSQDTSAWSEIFTFYVKPDVVLKDPSDGDIDLGFAVPLRWEEIKGSLKYEYMLSTDEAFSAPFRYYTIHFKDTTADLTFGQTYYWKTRALHTADTSGWTPEPFSFTTINTPILLTPEDGEENVPILLTNLVWEHVPGIDMYEVNYALNDDFTDGFMQYEGPDTTSVFRVSINLFKDTTYFWRVRYIQPEQYDTSGWSEVRSFRTLKSVNPGAVNENDFANSMKLFPNPVNNSLNISLDVPASRGAEISIFDIAGKKISADQVLLRIGENSISMDVAGFAEGVYILQVNSEGSVATQKFVIKR